MNRHRNYFYGGEDVLLSPKSNAGGNMKTQSSHKILNKVQTGVVISSQATIQRHESSKELKVRTDTKGQRSIKRFKLQKPKNEERSGTRPVTAGFVVSNHQQRVPLLSSDAPRPDPNFDVFDCEAFQVKRQNLANRPLSQQQLLKIRVNQTSQSSFAVDQHLGTNYNFLYGLDQLNQLEAIMHLKQLQYQREQMLSPIMTRLNNTAITIQDFYGATNLFNNEKLQSPQSSAQIGKHTLKSPIQTFAQMRQSPPKIGQQDMIYLQERTPEIQRPINDYQEMAIPHRISSTSSYLRNSTPKSLKKLHVKVDISSRHLFKTPADDQYLLNQSLKKFVNPLSSLLKYLNIVTPHTSRTLSQAVGLKQRHQEIIP